MTSIGNNINTTIFGRTLVGAAILLATAHCISAIMTSQLDGDFFSKIGHIFDLDSERNVPTVYTGLILGCCAFIGLLSLQLSRSLIQKSVWILLSMFYLYLAFDEILIVHETFAAPIRNLLSISDKSYLYHAWVIPALAITLSAAFIAFFLAAKKKISPHQKNIMLITFILITGVVLLEIIGTKLYFSPLLYKLGPVFVEEMLEISLLSLVLYRLTVGLNKA